MKNKLWIGVLISGFLWGCQHPETADPESSNEIRITSRVLTRAGMEQGFIPGDKIGLYMTAEAYRTAGFDQAKNCWLNNHPFSLYADNSWKSSYVAQWESPTAVADAVGYYPYDMAKDEETNLKVLPCRISSDQRTIDSLRYSDFLWARTEGVGQTDGLLSLAFNHRMSKIVFRLQVTAEDPQLDLSQVHAIFHNVYTNASIDLNTGEVTCDENKQAEVHAYNNSSLQQVECMLVPQVIPANSRVTFFFGDNVNSQGFQYVFNEEVRLSSGKEYLIDLIHHFNLKDL